MKASRTFVLGATIAFGAAAACAADYPDRPIRFVTPAQPGGTTDILARMIGIRLSDVFKQQVIVDNRGGAGGTLGAAIAARAAPDGYTLMMGSVASLGTAQGLFKDLPYNPLNDFTPVTLAARSPSGFLTALNLPAKSVKEVIAFAKG